MRSTHACFTAGEKMAPDDSTQRRDDTSVPAGR
jgi:hypothetical protein